MGTTSNLLVYLTAVFNLKSITAVTLINVFYGTTNLGTLVGAFVSDTYFGRYKTLAFAAVTSFMVLLLLILLKIQWLNHYLLISFANYFIFLEGDACDYADSTNLQAPSSSLR